MEKLNLLNVDWDRTIDRFFISVDAALGENFNVLAQSRASHFYDLANNFYEASRQLAAVRENPRKYADYGARIRDKLVIAPTVFIPYGTSDNSLYVAYNSVMHAMEQFYRYEVSDFYQRNLLDAIKKWDYVQSKNKFKVLYHSFLPATHFVVQKQNTK